MSLEAAAPSLARRLLARSCLVNGFLPGGPFTGRFLHRFHRPSQTRRILGGARAADFRRITSRRRSSKRLNLTNVHCPCRDFFAVLAQAWRNHVARSPRHRLHMRYSAM